LKCYLQSVLGLSDVSSVTSACIALTTSCQNYVAWHLVCRNSSEIINKNAYLLYCEQNDNVHLLYYERINS